MKPTKKPAAKKAAKKQPKAIKAVKKAQDSRIFFILDRSGSMSKIQLEALDGFNTFVEEQKAIKAKTRMSLILFNNRSTPVFRDLDVQEVKPLLLDQYNPQGMTSLYDVIGSFVKKLTETPFKKSEKTIIAILTDGDDTSSQHYQSYAQIKPFIDRAQEECGFEVLFVGTNMDARGAAQSMGIKASNTTSFDYTGKGAVDVMKTMSMAATAYRGIAQNMKSASGATLNFTADNMDITMMYDSVKNEPALKKDPATDPVA